MEIKSEAWGKEVFVNVENLIVDRQAQKDLRENHYKNIAKNFDPKAFGRPLISPRENGKYHIADGQHRVEAAKLKGIDVVPCVLVDNETLKDDAQVFLLASENRNASSALEKYRIGLTAEDKDWLRVKEILDYAEVESGKGINQIACVGEIKRNITHNHSFDNTKEAFKIVVDTWGAKGTTSSTLGGMIVFYNKHIITGNTTVENTIKTLKKFNPSALTNEARKRKQDDDLNKDTKHYVAYIFEKTFNKKTKGKKLHTVLQRHIYGE